MHDLHAWIPRPPAENPSFKVQRLQGLLEKLLRRQPRIEHTEAFGPACGTGEKARMRS